jgi:hypothetical protein
MRERGMENKIIKRCRICHRVLKNYSSVKSGMGPVCGKRENQQGVFDFMHAEIGLVKHERGKYIFIRDTGHGAVRSVTNDAEYVVEQLCLEFEIGDETRIFYEDSSGQIDELLHSGRTFRGCKAGHEGVAL